MKKTAPTRKRVLQLAPETIRTLSGGELARVNAGCDLTTDTTMHTDSATQRNCGGPIVK